MKIKIGDRVKIREDLEREKLYNGIRYNEYMVEYAGQIATVEEISDIGEISLDIDNRFWCWDESMLVPIAPASCPCGLLSLGLQAKEVTMEQYTEQVRNDPVLSRKYFRRFVYCPDCARLIDWGQVE